MSSIHELVIKHGIPVTVQAKDFPAYMAFTIIEDKGEDENGIPCYRVEGIDGQRYIVLGDVASCNDYQKVGK